MLLRSFALGLVTLTIAGLAIADPIATSNVPNTDQEITRQVELLIDQHPDMGTMLSVRTKNGVVYVGGNSGTPLSLANVDGLVRQVPGVVGVVDIVGIEE
jgi:hypothetical protein